MKVIGYLLVSGTLFASCGQAAPKVKIEQKIDTIAPVRDSLAGLTGPEMQHYSNIVGHFFDSMLAGRFNGSVLVAKKGVIVYERYKGFTSPIKKKDSLNFHTAFHLASVSKTFTAMGTLKLWQEGKLDIHDPVAKYLPGFPFEGLTIQMLLNHRSGLRNYVHFMNAKNWNIKKFLSNNDVLAYIIAHPKEVQGAQPGRHFEYSNTNYALLALIIEKASGLSYSDYLSQTFFQPLKMADSYVFNLGDTATAMQSYYLTGRPFRLEFLDQVYGDKNVFSTVRDMYKWDQALRSGQLFTKGVLDSAYSPYSFEKPGKRNYGLGWRMLLIPNGKKLLYHNGWWHGNRTVFIRMLDEDATIIAFSNNDFKQVYSAKKLCDLFGDYRQGNESFEEGEAADLNGKGGEPKEVKKATPHQPVKKNRKHHKKKK